MKRLAIGLSVALCCIGCDRAADGPAVADASDSVPSASGADAADPSAPVGTAPTGTASPKISAGYLAGPWCHLYTEVTGLYDEAGERSEERIDYVFSEGGTLLYQTNPRTPVDQKGTWTLDGEKLSIGPAIRIIATDVHSVDRDSFALGKFTHVVFARGACARHANTAGAGRP